MIEWFTGIINKIQENIRKKRQKTSEIPERKKGELILFRNKIATGEYELQNDPFEW